MTLLTATIIAIGMASPPRHALAQGPRPVTVAAGQMIRGDLASFDQPIVIDGTVEGDVTSWSGTITVHGEVRGDVVSYAGNIDLGPGARVRGSVLSLGGGVAHAAEASVAGQVLGERPLAGGAIVSNMAAILQPQPSAAASGLPLALISAALALISLILSVTCAAIWPRRTLGVSRALRRAPGRSLAIGLLTTALAALLLLPLGGLIALSLVGLPLLLPLALVLQAPYLFGLAGMGRAMGERLLPGGASAAAAAGIAILLVPLGVVGAVSPLWGLALFYLVASAGLGATILSRGGAYALRA
ncbi:polymer-forming cytoskeletal protein [Oscillochloris sp. ZM17-4]|uniref:bactofilin family protein n=1 Tax=Oscillochloris sp. ZM17-4 TaxID=2866714 RepID=UPI001C72D84D|nr:polymer-forming cytoskeletal protein [Oscillochloris sp. ZM17-4]MBX0328555.1 polymer-forming cytoskeletal protein [Oscillochloris sp. ZM17-4]